MFCWCPFDTHTPVSLTAERRQSILWEVSSWAKLTKFTQTWTYPSPNFTGIKKCEIWSGFLMLVTFELCSFKMEQHTGNLKHLLTLEILNIRLECLWLAFFLNNKYRPLLSNFYRGEDQNSKIWSMRQSSSEGIWSLKQILGTVMTVLCPSKIWCSLVSHLSNWDFLPLEIWARKMRWISHFNFWSLWPNDLEHVSRIAHCTGTIFTKFELGSLSVPDL